MGEGLQQAALRAAAGRFGSATEVKPPKAAVASPSRGAPLRFGVRPSAARAMLTLL